MIIPDKKKTVSIILSKMKPDGTSQSAPMKPEEEMGPDSTLKAIAEDVMLALEHRSAIEFMDAMKAFIDEYNASGSPEESGDSE